MWTRRGFLLSGRAWDVVGLIARRECKGRWLLKLLSVGFGDGVRCSRSLLCGLPPPTRLYLSLGADRIEQGSIRMVKGKDGGVGPIQSDGVMTESEVESLLIRGVLLGNGMEKKSPGI